MPAAVDGGGFVELVSTASLSLVILQGVEVSFEERPIREHVWILGCFFLQYLPACGVHETLVAHVFYLLFQHPLPLLNPASLTPIKLLFLLLKQLH